MKKPKSSWYRYQNNENMWLNYLKIALRNSWSNKLPTVINVMSLALGIAACLLIYLFIQDERSFDAFHSKKGRIYRLWEVQSFTGTNPQDVALSMSGMGPNLVRDYPEIETYARYWGMGKQLFERGDQRFMIEQTSLVDSTFLQVFDFELLAGDRETALSEPYSLVITEETAEKFFGHEDPVGESLVRSGDPYKITGVLKNIPENSHLQFDALATISTVTREEPGFNNQFGNNFLVTYVVMSPNADVVALDAKMPEFLTRSMPPSGDNPQDVNDFYELHFQELADVHLASSNMEHDYQNYRKFNGEYLEAFAVVGLLILLIAGVNFMNLVTARASHRWKEIGVRKTVGARKGQLFSQFALESAFLGAVSFVLALAIDLVFTPLLNNLIGRELSMGYYLGQPGLLLMAFGLTIGIGFLAGLYPSLYLASYDAVRVLKGGDVKNRKSVFQSSLVVLQFGLAIAMIVSTLLVIQQLRYMKTKDLGFNKDHILLVEMNDEANRVYETIKEELVQNPLIKGVTASGQRIGNNFHQWGFKLRTDSIRGMTPSNVNVDFNYLDVYDIKIKEGRGFSREFGTDAGLAFVINESLAKELNLENPVGISAGHSWYPDDSLGTIIGVAEDFNFNSLHYEINTLAMVVHPEWGYSELSIKVANEDIPGAIAAIERTWNQLVPSWPFAYTFLDEHFAELYRSDQQMESVVTIMAFLAIFIACMGLFGLAAITTERKVKEIGIRKILGASISQIMYGLSRNYVLLLGLAFAIFSPFTYLVMRGWLQGFAYRIDIHPVWFLAGGLIAFLIALLTVSYHTFRSARSNPVESLRYE